ncbi:MAG TPA: hypothetical protein VI455_07520 [Terriglobia bacterium]
MIAYLIRLYRHKRTVRWAAALGAFGAVLAAEYLLAAIPFVPVDLQDTGQFAPAVARAAEQALVIEQPVLDGASQELVSHDGRANEAVDVYFDQARLANESVARLKALGLSPPAFGSAIDYVTESSGNEGGRGATCRTSVVVLGDGAKTPGSVSFFQHEAASSDRYRSVEMKAGGAEVSVRLDTVIPFPLEGSSPAPACRVLLKVGDWKQALNGSLGITFIASEDSNFRFHFESVAKRGLAGGPDGLFEPFTLGTGEFFQARGLRIGALDAGGAPVLSAESPAGKPPLRVEHLKLGGDQLQINALGKGRVTVKGKSWTVDVLDTLTKSPTLATLITLANGALFTWLRKALLNRRSAAEPESEAHPAARRRRRRERNTATVSGV